MKRTRLVRRKRLGVGRSEGPRRVSKRRAGLSSAEHAELKELHRRCIMRLAGITPIPLDRKKVGWYGPCEHCGHSRWLSVCHIEPKGQFPRMKYDPLNAWAGCYRCHIHWWHKNPGEAEKWIRAKMGEEMREGLALRARTAGKLDFQLTKLYLLNFLAQNLMRSWQPFRKAQP